MHVLVSHLPLKKRGANNLSVRSVPQVCNDDGPPSDSLSPYIQTFVDTLQQAGHATSVVLPDASRSWIGKAHIVGATIKATYVRPDNVDAAYRPPVDKSATPEDDWVLVSGTPASCVQLGLYYLFKDRPPIDLVVSGPNHGRNASTIYTLASGTVGGALEAVTCGKRAIALSFASKDSQPRDVISAASRLAVKLIEHLSSHWDEGVELYNVNIPMLSDIETRPVRYSTSLQSYWSKSSLFQEIQSEKEAIVNGTSGLLPAKERYFAWAPDLTDIKQAIDQSEEGTDTWTVKQGFTSVTPMAATFPHPTALRGEIDLKSST